MGFLPGCGDAHEEAFPVVLDHAGADPVNKLHLKYPLYRIKACLLLKGKPIDELDEAALERKYPPELILENSYFFHYLKDDAFGWYFDSDLCLLSSLSDYQRLVLFNYAMSYAKLAGLHPIYGLFERWLCW